MRGLATPLILVVVLAGLGGYIYFVEMKKPEASADSKAKAFNVTAEQIEELEIKVTGGDTSLARRTDSAWKLVQPVEADADGSELTNMASSLATLDVQRVVDENPTDLAQYGLNPPAVEVGFRTKDQKNQGRLQIGDKTPTGGDVYAKRPDEKRVFLVSSFLEDTFKRSAFDLRDKTILKFDREKVDGLELTKGGTTLQFARKGADWSIVKPASMRADYATVEGLVTSLSSTLMQKFVAPDATPAELRQYGLDTPSASASILMGSARASLLLGRTENAETYAKDAARPSIMMVAPTIVTDLSKTLADFRRKELFDLRSFSTKRVELKRGADTFVAEKTSKDGKDVWRDAAGKDLDTAKVEDMLTKLSGLKAVSFDAGTSAALRSPTLTVQASFGENTDENRTESVTFANAGNAVVASRPDEPGTAKLDGQGFSDVMQALDSLR
ncbi:MAG: DUF4340 domain-containing protein [Vicinamibacterales bacterium]